MILIKKINVSYILSLKNGHFQDQFELYFKNLNSGESARNREKSFLKIFLDYLNTTDTIFLISVNLV